MGSTVTYNYSGNSKSQEDNAFKKFDNYGCVVCWEATASTHFDT